MYTHIVEGALKSERTVFEVLEKFAQVYLGSPNILHTFYGTLHKSAKTSSAQTASMAARHWGSWILSPVYAVTAVN